MCRFLLKRMNYYLLIFSSQRVTVRGQSWRRGTKSDCKIDWLWVRTPFEEVKYLFTFIFSFLRSAINTKGGVEFRHSTLNASNSAKSGERRVLTLGLFCRHYRMRDIKWGRKKIYKNKPNQRICRLEITKHILL